MLLFEEDRLCNEFSCLFDDDDDDNFDSFDGGDFTTLTVNCGGLFFGIKNNTLIGCRSEFGGSPLANSIAVIPNDQISAFES
ncbi:hypothetical protein DERP_000612 [Dermatophagoides pteronyssinus]|uniref:Uncharacterized protein n=1 Tax=Dermatophagoides pteronyssinus TaxID=6956 RepID=A0ABQ8J167_DERPT|nr:hypothetical protein DERP_000612 [Dermatophagoides pteronyssinus]